MGAMLQAGYKSLESYMSAARTRNSELGFAVPVELRAWMRGAERAVIRNRGRSDRAVLFDVEEIARTHAADEESTVSAGPVLAVAALVTACWWMLRAIELINLRIESVLFHSDTKKVELRLGKTKTDIQGISCRRIFDCVCATALAPRLCPYHVLHTVSCLRESSVAQPSDPLFAAKRGGFPTHDGTVTAWRRIVGPDATVDDWGDHTCRELTGHSPRRVGAQWLTRLGLSLWQVMYIGRWGSQSVERYISEAAAWEKIQVIVGCCCQCPKYASHKGRCSRQRWYGWHWY